MGDRFEHGEKWVATHGEERLDALLAKSFPYRREARLRERAMRALAERHRDELEAEMALLVLSEQDWS